MTDFEKDQKEDKPCPLCGKPLLFVDGLGWDYDRSWCSDRKCSYEKEYETSKWAEENEE